MDRTGEPHGGRSVWHLIPRSGIKRQARYDGSIEDERRLFYVAVTRSQKFLHLTWEDYDVALPGSALGRVAPLITALRTTEVRATISALGGYDTRRFFVRRQDTQSDHPHAPPGRRDRAA